GRVTITSDGGIDDRIGKEWLLSQNGEEIKKEKKPEWTFNDPALENQRKYLVNLSKSTNREESNWAKIELTKLYIENLDVDTLNKVAREAQKKLMGTGASDIPLEDTVLSTYERIALYALFEVTMFILLPEAAILKAGAYLLAKSNNLWKLISKVL